MKILEEEISRYLQSLGLEEQRQLDDELEELDLVYPFNRSEFILSYLMTRNVITWEDFLDIRKRYSQRNKYLKFFELAPRSFGETWGQSHLMKMVPEFQKPTSQLDPLYKGEYDLWLEGIHVEVKASRVVKKESGGTLVQKALKSGSIEKFDMNFQQLKPECCDVFVWMAMWIDKIDYWVIPSDNVKHSPLFSNQHRGSQTTALGEIVEGQIHINNDNYASFEPYRVEVDDIRLKILEIGKRY